VTGVQTCALPISAGKPTPQEAQRSALAQIEAAIRRLDALTAVAAAQHPRSRDAGVLTLERLALLGSAYKRKAWISVADRPEALQRSRDFYAQAHARRNDAYPFLNLLTAEIALGWISGAALPALADLIDAELPDVRAALRDALTRDRGFWNSAMLADLALLEALARRTLDRQTLQSIASGYRAAAERGTPRQRASVQDQLDFIAAVAMQQEPQICAWIEQLRDEIAGKAGGSRPDANDAAAAPARRVKGSRSAARGKRGKARSRKTRTSG